MNCPEGYVPGWLDGEGNPTSCVNDNPYLEGIEIPTQPPVTELPNTGLDPLSALVVGALLLLVGGVTVVTR